MAHFIAHFGVESKGIRPSTTQSGLDIPTPTGRRMRTATPTRRPIPAVDSTDSPDSSHCHPSQRAQSTTRAIDGAAKSVCRAVGLADRAGLGGATRGYGGLGGGRAGRVGNARGTPAQTRSGFGVGARVRNASGRGVWGFGTIVGIIPSGVNPRWFCRRHDFPCVFGRRCDVVYRERFVVMGDDGRYHVPRKVEVE